MDLGLQGRKAIVTGASRGIGLAVARRLAREGAQLHLVARSAPDLAAAAAGIRALSGRDAAVLAADVGTPEGRAAVLDTWPETDVLVINVGAPQRSARFDTLSRADWDRWMEAHFHAALELIRPHAAAMADRGFGRIVNLSASFIKFPRPGVAHSHAARLALAGAIASIAREVVDRGVTINSVLPGLIETDALRAALAERAGARGVSLEQVMREAAASCPAGRIAQPEEIADLVAMLAAASMGYVTAQNIVADGGSYPGLF